MCGGTQSIPSNILATCQHSAIRKKHDRASWNNVTKSVVFNYIIHHITDTLDDTVYL